MKKDDSFLAKERNSFLADKRRRENGLGTIEVEKSIYTKARAQELVSIEPFQEWIEKCLRIYSVDEFALIVETSPRSVHRWRTGKEIDKRGILRTIKEIPIHTVDIATTREGSSALWELYPKLYE